VVNSVPAEVDSVFQEANAMTLNAPSMPIFVIAVILAVLAIVGTFVALPVITPYSFWVAIIAFVLLAVGSMMKTGV
jgi:hypothetical protein